MSKTDHSDGAGYAPSTKAEQVVGPGEFRIAAAYLDHGHIYGQCNGLTDAGATLVSVFDPDPARVSEFCAKYPGVSAASSFEEILQNPTIHMVTSAAIPAQRAAIGLAVLAAGKDYFTDKSPFTSLTQLEAVRDAASASGQKYMVYYAERLHNDAAWHAGELIAQGAIGRVLQVLNLAPHRLSKTIRPDWFFDKSAYGGILTDIGSHQVEQFLSYAGCQHADINFARVCNHSHPDKPGLEDFGELSMTGDNGASFYTRVDWYTPNGQCTWGDGRSFILGTEGSIEVRKYQEVAVAAPTSNLYITDASGERRIENLDKSRFPFFGQLILDCLNRTEHAMSQAHAFKAAELSMQAQKIADER